MIFKLLLVLAILYLGIVAVAFVTQERMLFPSHLVLPAGPLPPGAERLEVRTPDGMRLEGVRIPASGAPDSTTLLLVFAGNASNAQGVAEEIHAIYPAQEVVAFFYRGYRPSGGATGARQLMEDAPLVYDLVAERLRPQRIVAIGISLGSGVAASLALRRPLAGLILVTPFDSLSATARQLYPWLPVAQLLRHDIRSAEYLRNAHVPVAIIAAGRDGLVLQERTEALRGVVPHLVYDLTIPEAQHNDIAIFPVFRHAMRQALTRIDEASKT